jgi:hypothetical protein
VVVFAPRSLVFVCGTTDTQTEARTREREDGRRESTSGTAGAHETGACECSV